MKAVRAQVPQEPEGEPEGNLRRSTRRNLRRNPGTIQNRGCPEIVHFGVHRLCRVPDVRSEIAFIDS